MRKNTKEVITFLNKIFDETNLIVQHEMIDIGNDKDINFFITVKMNLEKIKMKSAPKILIYYTDYNVITIYSPTLYKLKDSDSLIYALNVINLVNSKIAVGKLYMSDNNTTISYINRIIFNEITTELTGTLLSEYLKSYILTAMEFYEAMKDKTI